MWHARFSLNEALVTSIIGHLKTQRPSALNFASKQLVTTRSKLCIPVPYPSNGAPRVTIVSPMVIGEREDKRLLVEYCYQLADLSLDFTPNSVGSVGVVLKASLHAGFGVPDPIPDSFLLLPGFAGPSVDETLPFATLQCTKLSMTASGAARWIKRSNRHFLVLSFDTLEVADASGNPTLVGLVKGFILPKLNLDVTAGAAFELNAMEFQPPSGTTPVPIPLVPDPQKPNPTFANDSMTVAVNLA